MHANRPRSNVRLQMESGVVSLFRAGLTDVTATITDLSEGGCLCIVDLDGIELKTQEGWKAAVVPGAILKVVFMAPAELMGAEIEQAEVRWARKPNALVIKFGLRFMNASNSTQALLQKTLFSLAKNRLQRKRKV